MRRGRPPHPDTLTPREQEVLSLIREGLTNEQIAQRLGISESGARYHVSEILSKLGVESRAQAAQWDEPGTWQRRIPALALIRAGVVAAGLASVTAVVVLVTVLEMGLLEDGGSDSPAGAPGQPSASDEGMGALLGLADEAEREARSVLPGAELYLVAYPETSGLYTFRFYEPGGLRDVGVVGPYVNDPTFPLWEVYEDLREADAQPPEPLELDQLEHDLGSIMDAVRAGLPYYGDLSIVLWSEAGNIRWGATPAVLRSRIPPFQCEGTEDLGSMICAIPTPIP